MVVPAASSVDYNGLRLGQFQDMLFGNGGNDTPKVSDTGGKLPMTIFDFSLVNG